MEYAAVYGMQAPSLRNHGKGLTVSSSVLHKQSSGLSLRRLLTLAGPGALIAVGYMDPGNWATNLAGGSRFGYVLLPVILLANLIAMLLQALSVRLGIASGCDLAELCRQEYPRPVAIGLWVLAEGAIVATDLAEVLGSALALNLLFGVPLVMGVALTALDVLVILALPARGVLRLETLVAAITFLVVACLLAELLLARPDLRQVLAGCLPSRRILTDPNMLYLAVGILGATVMPHNLYLHSGLVRALAGKTTPAAREAAIRAATRDSNVSLLVALFVNAALLVLAAATFFRAGRRDVVELGDAYRLLSPLLGGFGASVVFGVALLLSSQNATLAGTLAGQIVMEGFLRIRLRPWLRRLFTRLLAILPALVVVELAGHGGLARLLLLSQAILSLQLPFAVFPLLRLTGNPRRMGQLMAPLWMQSLGWLAAVGITSLNLYLLCLTAHDLRAGNTFP